MKGRGRRGVKCKGRPWQYRALAWEQICLHRTLGNIRVVLHWWSLSKTIVPTLIHCMFTLSLSLIHTSQVQQLLWLMYSSIILEAIGGVIQPCPGATRVRDSGLTVPVRKKSKQLSMKRQIGADTRRRGRGRGRDGRRKVLLMCPHTCPWVTLNCYTFPQAYIWLGITCYVKRSRQHMH